MISLTKVFKERGDWVGLPLPGCMEELFYAFKYFDFDNRRKKKYEWGEKGLKLFFDKYDFDNKMKWKVDNDTMSNENLIQ